jgi:hypothetical protein
MGNILMLIAGPLAIRVLLALGFGWVSYEVLSTIAGNVSDLAVAYYQGMSSQMAIGIILGAILSRAAFASIPRLQKLTT